MKKSTSAGRIQYGFPPPISFEQPGRDFKIEKIRVPPLAQLSRELARNKMSIAESQVGPVPDFGA